MTAPRDIIARADAVLVQPPAHSGQIDPRWLALIDVGDLIEQHPEEVWPFVARWGAHADDDVRAAVAACLLEHLLEHHFEAFFPRVEEAAANPLFADTFSLCWKFGQAELPANSARFDRLMRDTAGRRERRARL